MYHIRNGKVCLDTLGNKKNQSPGVYSCHGTGGNQVFYSCYKSLLNLYLSYNWIGISETVTDSVEPDIVDAILRISRNIAVHFTRSFFATCPLIENIISVIFLRKETSFYILLLTIVSNYINFHVQLVPFA